jgi:predicted Zn-dependent protease
MEGRSELIAVVERGRALGARALEVLRIESESLEQAGARGRPVTGSATRWIVRAWLPGGALGVGESTTAEHALADAMRGAEAAPDDPHGGPADRMAIPAGSLGIDDRRHAQISDADRNDVLHTAERAIALGGLACHDLLLQQRREVRSWVSTRGVEGSAGATTYRLSASAPAGEWTARYEIASRKFSDVASLPFGTELRRRAESLATPTAMPGGDGPVVLEPRVMAELVRAIAPAFSASAVAAGVFTSAWWGRPLASEALHLTDDAGLASGLRSRPFDERGVPPIPVALLKEGVVAGWYHDPETARRAGLRPTGHVWDGALRPSNLVVRPGSRTRNVILSSLRDYLALDRVPPVDLAAGRFVGPVPVLVVRDGQRVGVATARMDISVRDLLHSVSELAADQERHGEVDAPTAVLVGCRL